MSESIFFTFHFHLHYVLYLIYFVTSIILIIKIIYFIVARKETGIFLGSEAELIKFIVDFVGQWLTAVYQVRDFLIFFFLLNFKESVK